MPLSTETIPQKGLSGRELQELIVGDLKELLSRDGMFQPHVAYGRISYEVEVRLHLDNFTYPKHLAILKSKSSKEKPQVENAPKLKDPSEGAIELDLQRTRNVVSPNATRIAEGMPVRVQVVEDGKLVEKELNYDKEILPEGNTGRDVQDVDKSPGAQEGKK
jgi:hypothetical protein